MCHRYNQGGKRDVRKTQVPLCVCVCVIFIYSYLHSPGDFKLMLRSTAPHPNTCLAYNKYLWPKLKEGWSVKQLPGKSKHMVRRHTLRSTFNGANGKGKLEIISVNKHDWVTP